MTLHTSSCHHYIFIAILSTIVLDQHGWVAHALSSQTTKPSTSDPYQTKDKPKNVNFVDWISDAPEEVRSWKSLQVDPSSRQRDPPYVQGTLIRNGGGLWSTENDMFSHIFDGLAKIHSYRISQSKEGADSGSTNVEYQARFLEGMWYKSYKATASLPFGIGTGPVLDKDSQETKQGPLRTAQALWNTVAKFDNTPVNIFDFQPNRKETNKPIMALTDAPPRTQVDLSTMNTISSSTMNKFAKGAKGYELLCTSKFVFEPRCMELKGMLSNHLHRPARSFSKQHIHCTHRESLLLQTSWILIMLPWNLDWMDPSSIWFKKVPISMVNRSERSSPALPARTGCPTFIPLEFPKTMPSLWHSH